MHGVFCAAASNGTRPNPSTTDGYSTSVERSNSHAFSASLTAPTSITAWASCGWPASHRASCSSEDPWPTVGPASTRTPVPVVAGLEALEDPQREHPVLVMKISSQAEHRLDAGRDPLRSVRRGR